MSISGVVIYGCILSCADTNGRDDNDILCRTYQYAHTLWQGRNKYLIPILLLFILIIAVLIHSLLEEWYWSIPLIVILIMTVITLGTVIKCEYFKQNDNNNTHETEPIRIDDKKNTSKTESIPINNFPYTPTFDHTNAQDLSTMKHMEHNVLHTNNPIYSNAEDEYDFQKDSEKSSVSEVKSGEHSNEVPVHTLVDKPGDAPDDSTGNDKEVRSLQQKFKHGLKWVAKTAQQQVANTAKTAQQQVANTAKTAQQQVAKTAKTAQQQVAKTAKTAQQQVANTAKTVHNRYLRASDNARAASIDFLSRHRSPGDHAIYQPDPITEQAADSTNTNTMTKKHDTNQGTGHGSYSPENTKEQSIVRETMTRTTEEDTSTKNSVTPKPSKTGKGKSLVSRMKSMFGKNSSLLIYDEDGYVINNPVHS